MKNSSQKNKETAISSYIQYLQDNPKNYWFKAKLYGWGWVPVKWQGWLTILVYVLLLLSIFKQIDDSSHSVNDTLIGVFIPFVVTTAVLISICLLKGERPHWSWGIPKHK